MKMTQPLQHLTLLRDYLAVCTAGCSFLESRQGPHSRMQSCQGAEGCFSVQLCQCFTAARLSALLLAAALLLLE
jgi:hypothetical protein